MTAYREGLVIEARPLFELAPTQLELGIEHHPQPPQHTLERIGARAVALDDSFDALTTQQSPSMLFEYPGATNARQGDLFDDERVA